MIDHVVAEIVGQARPVVDRAIDSAAIMALGKAVDLADNLRENFPGSPASIEGELSADAAYFMGWDDALAALTLAVRGVRNRIQSAADQATEELAK